ncbi:MAG: peptidase M16 [Gallionellales bacterium 35-53-114]|jgi:zinc protease|nr:MAG: peptidase M16 [Gallionellales bacterium 35-53-114]OYZ64174.1 MAG: peptidase M16 [Gallionellales bacterium 24-53-125]OZB10517.1 MAG: peptidase M16 [Gallionellales bacterium 39-52-133]HQS57137.1 pitrilysin family protein [Gallionellaceae bacterium]HQS74675.1 pitrilysin family protein [Gallionellaceae bacterium]
MRANLIAVIATGLLLVFSTAAIANPKIQHWQAASGARVYFVENHDLPMLDVAVNFPAGSGFDSAEKAGLAALTHGLLALGSEGMSEDDVARKMADIGAQLGGHFDADRSNLSVRTLSSRAERDEALAILARVLQRPLFPEAVLAREKTRLIAALKEAETKPESIAAKAFSKAVFGWHPYGLPSSGDIASVEKLQRADLDAFYSTHYGAKAAVVALMGDISRAEAEAIAQNLTAQLPPGGASSEIPQVVVQSSASTLRIPHPATQSHILIGAPGVARSDEDYFPLYVGNYILGGGGFVSRLMQEVREKRGMAYSVYSYFVPMQQPGVFQIGLQTRKDQADEALQVVNTTLLNFIEKGVSEKELTAAKQNIINGFPLRIDSNKKILDYLSAIGFYHLPLSYMDDFPARISKVSVADISAAFRRKVNPDVMATVIVGAPEEKSKIDQLEGAGK